MDKLDCEPQFVIKSTLFDFSIEKFASRASPEAFFNQQKFAIPNKKRSILSKLFSKFFISSLFFTL